MEWYQIQVLFLLLILLVKGNASEKSGKGELNACSTLSAAKTANEEVAKLFKSVCLSEVVEPYLSLWYDEHENTYGSCFPDDIYNRKGEKTTYFRRFIYGPLAKVAEFSNTFGSMVQKIESLKKNITDAAEIFRTSWTEMKKILKMNEGFFQAFDVFFQDTIMQRAANISSKAHKESSDKNRAKSYFNKFDEDFEKASELMRLIPNRPSMTSPEKFKQNVLFNQFYSAMYGTRYMPNLKRYGYNVDKNSVFTEISIKNNLKIAITNLVEAYIVGYDEALEFSNKSREYERRLDTVVEKINAISPEKSCSSTRKEAKNLASEASMLQTLVQVFMGVRPLMDFDAKAAKFFSEKKDILQLMNQVRQALSFVKHYIPRDVHPELDQLYLYVTSTADKSVVPKFVKNFDKSTAIWLHSVTNKDWVKHYQKLDVMVNRAVKLTQCYLNIYQIFGQTFQSCSEGVGSLRDVYDEISSRIPTSDTECWSFQELSRPSFEEIQEFIEKAATKFGFNKECAQNNQQDEPGDVRSIVIDDYSDESEKRKLSPSQRFTVCDLRVKYSKSDEEINEKMAIDNLDKIKAVRCKNSKRSRRADSMYARDKQVHSY